MSRYRTRRPAVSECTACPGGVRRRYLRPPFKSAELTLSGLKYYHDGHFISQPDKPLINIRLIHHFLRHGVWIITDFLCMHRYDSHSSQVNAHFWLGLGRGIPSISTAYAQAWRRCAQVIHMFVHRQRGAVVLSAGRRRWIGTGAGTCRPGQRAACWPPRHAGAPAGYGQGSATAGLTSSAGGSQAESHAESQAAPSSAPT
jgi:hypothetical protein